MGSRLIFSLLAMLTFARVATAAPIFIDETRTRFYSIDLLVSSSLTLLPGEEGFLQAALRNTGTEPITFKPYDTSTRSADSGGTSMRPASPSALPGSRSRPESRN